MRPRLTVNTGQAAIDIAVQRRARLVLVVNGLVPINTNDIAGKATAEGARRTIYDRGMRGIQNQVLRNAHHESLTSHLQLLRERHQDVDFVLLEPRPDDEKMPFHQAMSFDARLIVMQHGYESMAAELLGNWSQYLQLFRSHGVELTPDVIVKRSEPIPAGRMTARPKILRQLRHTVLDRRLRQRPRHEGGSGEMAPTGRALEHPEATS